MKKLNLSEYVLRKIVLTTQKICITLLSFYLKQIDIDNDEKRFFRSALLKDWSTQLSQIVDLLNYRQRIVVDSTSISVNLDGVNLEVSGTGRYFKIPGTAKNANEGKAFYEFFNETCSPIDSVIDVGANVGEISLYFSKICPRARILAIEGSSENYAILKRNANNQQFPIDNLELIHRIITDHDGETEISKGRGSENSIIGEVIGSSRTETVKASTLSSVINEFNLDNSRITFIKIDIEGAGPLLATDLIRIKPKFIFFEFGFVSFELYTEVLHFFREFYTPYKVDFFRAEFELIDHDKLKLDVQPSFGNRLGELSEAMFVRHT